MSWKILLADDEPWILKSLHHFLEAFPDEYEIIGEVLNGKDALEQIKSQKPDIVISDIRMPDLDGISLLKELHSLNLPTKVILLSGYAEFQYAKEAVRYRAADYLVKPLNRNELKHVLERISAELDQEKTKRGEFRSASDTEPSANHASDLSLTQKLLEELDRNYTLELSLSDLAEKYGVNATYLSNLISQATGKTFTKHIMERRLAKAKELLSNQDLSVREIGEQVGYHDYFYFTKLFKKHMGISPSKYQKAQQNGE